MSETNLADIKKTVDGLGTAWEQFKAANATRLDEIEKKGKASAETEQKLSKINESLDALGKLKDEIDSIKTAMGRPGVGGAGGHIEVKSHDGKRALSADEVKHRDAVVAYIRKGIHVDPEIERKAMSVVSDSDGGFLVTPDMNGRIIQREFETSEVRQVAAVQTIASDAMEGNTDLNEADAGWVHERGTRAETNTAQIGVWRIPTHEIYANPKLTQKIIDDANINIEQFLARKIADKISRVTNTAFVSGDGNGKPRGFITYPNGTADRQIEQIKTGFAGGFLASGGADCLITMLESLKQKYQTRAKWAMTRQARRLIRQLKDDQKQYLWQPSLQAGVPDQLLGLDTTIFQDLPTPANGALGVALADWQEAYQIVDRLGIRTLRNPYKTPGFVEFYTVARVGGDVLNFEAIKLLDMSV